VSKVRLAIIGVGHLGRIHARILAENHHGNLVAVVDPSQTAREEVARQHDTRPMADYRQLVGQVDAAILAAPTQLHHAIGLDLLRAGIHLLIEKPLAATGAEAKELVETARQHRAVLQVGHVERFNPAFSAALPHVQDAKYIEATRASNFTFRSTDIGVVFDLMIHDLDLVLTLINSPVRTVEALGLGIFGENEDVAHARITFENGCIADLKASRACPVATRTMQIWSANGLAQLDFAQRQAQIVRPHARLLRREFHVASLSTEEIEGWKPRVYPDLLSIEQLPSEPCDQIIAEQVDFVDSIVQNRPPKVTGRNGRDAVLLAESVVEAIQRHAWDGTSEGRHGPLAVPRRQVIPAPHWHVGVNQPAAHREAG
jgi:predicted dehydrogenase